ncbi:MAG: hypothetical protein ACJ77A_16970 [Actinomycetota bacterium]
MGESTRAFGRVFTNPNLRRLQTAFAGAWVTDWAFMVALGILAFRRGGAVSVGIAGLSRMLPAAVVSPLTSFLGDRYRRNVLLIWVQVAWAVAWRDRGWWSSRTAPRRCCTPWPGSRGSAWRCSGASSSR